MIQEIQEVREKIQCALAAAEEDFYVVQDMLEEAVNVLLRESNLTHRAQHELCSFVQQYE